MPQPLIYYFGISRLLILACLFYRKTPWSYNLGQTHEKLNSKPNLPPPPLSQIMDETAPFSHPCMEGRRYKFPI